MFHRRKRNEAIFNSLTKLIGYSALVASLVYVVLEKTMRTSKLDDVYLESVYDETPGKEQSNWSGIKESQPALLSGKSSAREGLKKAAEAVKETPVAVATTEISKAPASPATTRPTDAPGLPKSNPAVSGITNLEAKRTLIEETVRQFFEAGTVGLKLAYVRDPSRVRPLMNEYYQRQPMTKPKWDSLGYTLPVDEPGYRLGYVQAIFSDGPAASLIVEEKENGSFAVDWESYVRYGELDWQDFLKLRPSQPKLFRVIASKAENADSAHRDSRLEMIELKHPEQEGSVFATIDKTDPELAPVIEQLQSGKWKDVPLTLRLCYPGSSGSGRAVRIAGVEGKGWLILQHTRS